ncbi:hypothetical protein J3F84DRAFT_23897 [Trichoderma pleuroticola]
MKECDAEMAVSFPPPPRKHHLGSDKLGSFSSFFLYKLRYILFILSFHIHGRFRRRKVVRAQSLRRRLCLTWLMGSIRWMGRCWSTGRSGRCTYTAAMLGFHCLFLFITPCHLFFFSFSLSHCIYIASYKYPHLR